MPIYTLENKETQETWEVNMTYEQLKITLNKDRRLRHVIKPIKIAANAGKSNISKAGEGWRDVLKEVKKNSGRRNNINV